ncbi:laccase [Oscillatoriales cyanobacterium USR001]|nr:laccase [Oscillatoriales cyanobacterium USR001]
MTVTRDRVPHLSASNQSRQPNSTTWHWHNWEGLPYLTCSLLDAWPHGFFTQNFSPKTPSDLVKILHSQSRVYRVKQVHGNIVLKTSEIRPFSTPEDSAITADESISKTLAEADGIITEKELEAVWVCSADCVPVLIADAETGKVAAVHAGWRGTAAKIVPEAIAHFVASGSQIANLRVALGPAIAGKVYQVSLDVAIQLGVTIAPKPTNPAELLEFLQQLPDAPVSPDTEPGKIRLDVRRFNVLQLEQLGVTIEQIAIAPECTYSNPTHFFSYRRDGQKKVQWSGIVSHKNS